MLTNHKNRYRLTLIALLTLALSGCKTWRPVDGEEFPDKHNGFVVTPEEGWFKSPYKAWGFLTFTKDGPDLQYISVGRRRHNRAFRAIRQESSVDDLPEISAEKYIADTKATLDLDAIEVVSNQPTELAGRPAFRLELAYKSESGLRYRETVIGMTHGYGLFLLSYRAPVLHYYDRDIAAFERFVETFRLRRLVPRRTISG